MEVGNRLVIEIEGVITFLDEDTIALGDTVIALDKVIRQKIRPQFDSGAILYSSDTVFYIKTSDGNWVYSANGGIVTEEYILELYDNGNLSVQLGE